MTQQPSRRKITINPSFFRDTMTDTDHLGFGPYIDALVRFLASPDTRPPLTISIEGEWGSGKSSFMNLLRRRLEERKYRTVWIDTWRNDGEEALWASLALEFVRQLEGKRIPIWPKLVLWVRRLRGSKSFWELARAIAGLALDVTVLAAFVLGGWIAWAVLNEVTPDVAQGLLKLTPNAAPAYKTVITWAGKIAPAASAGAALLTLLRVVTGNLLTADLKRYLRNPQYEDHLSLLNRFHQDFRYIVDAYTGNKPVFVFIDDLDRADPAKATELMQAISLMIADNPKVFFVIGMDRQKVAAGIALKNAKLLPFLYPTAKTSDKDGEESTASLSGISFGFSAIEKLVQVPYRVPQPTVRELRDLLLAGAGAESPSWWRRFMMWLQNLGKTIGRGVRAVVGTLGAWGQAGVRWIKAWWRPNAGENREVAAADGVRVAASVDVQVVTDRVRSLDVRLGTDSPEMLALLAMVAPILNANPRRVKQFYNLVRLYAWTAEETGLFDHVSGPGGRKALTLQQVAKFLVISLKWPALVGELAESPTLVRELQLDATGQSASETAKRWWNRYPELEGLFAYAPGHDPTVPPEAYDLSGADLRSLLRVWPKVDPPPVGDEPPPVSPPSDTPKSGLPSTSQLRSQGDNLMRSGQLAGAEDAYDRALEIVGDDDLERAHLLLSRGNLLSISGKPEEADFALNQAMEIYSRQNYDQGKANVLRLQADLSMKRAQDQEAERGYRAALSQYAKAGDRLGQANVFKALGDVYANRGKLPEADQHYERALALYDELREWAGHGNTLIARAGLFGRRGLLGEARADYEAALQEFDYHDHDLGMANALHGLGEVLAKQGDLDRATDMLKRAMDKYERMGVPRGEANARQSLGDVLLEKGQLLLAEESLSAALEIYQRLEDRVGQANTLYSLGTVAEKRVNPAESAAHYRRALEIYQRLGGTFEAEVKELRKKLGLSDPGDAPF